MHLLASTLHQGCYRIKFMRLTGNLCQKVEATVSRSPGWRPQARKCLEQRVVARRIARDEAWSDSGIPHGRRVPGGLRMLFELGQITPR